MSRQEKNVNDSSPKGTKAKVTTFSVPSEYEDQVSELLARLNVENKHSADGKRPNGEDSEGKEGKQPEGKQRERKDPEDMDTKGEDSEDEDSAYEVQSVVSHKISKEGVWSFQLRFKGFRELEWVLDEDCTCEGLISAYLEKVKAPPTLYAICRVSTKNQASPGHVSLDAQEHSLRVMLNKTFEGDNARRIKCIRISESAYKGIPKPLQEIGEVARKGDIISIYRIDRLSRNIIKFLAFLEDLNDRGVKIYSKDERIWYSTSRLLFIQGIVDANKEAELLGKRVRQSIAQRRRRGDEWIGGSVKYGWSLGRDSENRIIYVRNEQEQKCIKTIRSEEKKGLSPKEIATSLNSRKMLKRNKPWTLRTVNTILQMRA